MRILLVDDDPVFSDIIIARLASRGHEDVTLARSAEHALNFVENAVDPFECYLLDIMLGDMDGIELCRRLRQRADCKSAPVIMITASQQAPLMDIAYEAGATDFLRKPLDEAELAGRITTAMLLVTSMRRERIERAALNMMLSSDTTSRTMSLAERLSFADIPGMMEYHALENRLLRLEDGLYQLSIFRIRIPGFQKLNQRSDRVETLQGLHDVSAKIAAAIPGRDLLLSYIGRGRFICCVLGKQSRVSGMFHSQIQTIAVESLQDIELNNGGKIDLAVTQLNQRSIVSRATAIALVRNEFELVSFYSKTNLPDIRNIEDSIFDRTDKLVSTGHDGQ